MDSSSDDILAAAAAAHDDGDRLVLGGEAGPAPPAHPAALAASFAGTSAPGGPKGKSKLTLKLSGRLGATRAEAQRQLQAMLEVTARVERAANLALDSAADPALTLDEAREHLAGLTGLRDELQAVDLSAIASVDAHPFVVTVEARTATIETLIGLFATREARFLNTTHSSQQTGLAGTTTPIVPVTPPPSLGATPDAETPPGLPPPRSSTPVAAAAAAASLPTVATVASAWGGGGAPSHGGPVHTTGTAARPLPSVGPAAASANAIPVAPAAGFMPPPPPTTGGGGAPPANSGTGAATRPTAASAPLLPPPTVYGGGVVASAVPAIPVSVLPPSTTHTGPPGTSVGVAPTVLTYAAGTAVPAGAPPTSTTVRRPPTMGAGQPAYLPPTTSVVAPHPPLPLPAGGVGARPPHTHQPWPWLPQPPPTTHTHFPFPAVAPVWGSTATLPPSTGTAPLSTGPYSAPPWSAVSNPYVTDDTRLGPEYYASFPYPWNVQPTPTAASHGDMLKVATNSLPKFDGKRANYLPWRGTFLPCVHLTTIPINLKVMLLRSTIKAESEDMRELASSIVFTAEGYRQAICMLERDYGGDESLLLVRQEALLTLPLLKEGDFQNLKTLYKRLGNFLNQWATLNGGALTSAESITFFRQLFNKIDRKYAHKYVCWAQEGARERGLQSLYLWLGAQYENHRIVAQYAEDRITTTSSTENKNKSSNQFNNQAAKRPGPYFPQAHLDRNFKQQAFHATASDSTTTNKDTKKQPCPLCGGNHTLGRCFKFRDMNAEDKRAFLMDARRCFLCFATNHGRQNCKVEYRCRACGGKHNTALHDTFNRQTTMVATDNYAAGDAPEQTDAEVINGDRVMVAAVPEPSKIRVSLRTVPVWLTNPINGKGKMVNALLDDGCTGGALVSTELASTLGLKGAVRETTTEGVGGSLTSFKTIFAPVCVAPLDMTWKRELVAQVMQNPAGTYQPVDWKALCHTFDHLKEVPFPRMISGGKVDVLLGNQCPFLHSSIREISSTPGEPMARLTPLGWTATGPTTPMDARRLDKVEQATLIARLQTTPQPLTDWNSPRISTMCLFARAQDAVTHDKPSPTDKQLLKLVENMLRVDDCVQTAQLSPREEYAIQQLRKSLVYADGQYQAACTWAPGEGRPSLNYTQALNRLVSLERSKYFQDAHLRRKYAEVIQLWEAESFVREVKLGTEDVAYLMPHFPILKDSRSTPIRPVMDCKIALNKFLLSGPNLLNNIDDVLLRYRSCIYTYSGDVKQMFLRIKLDPQDAPYHCFLWRRSPGDSPTVFQFRVHVFGNTGSPFVAVFVVQEHARKYIDVHPQAVDTLVNSTLIDDVLDSTDSVTQAATIMLQLRQILSEAGMSLVKCHSNHSRVLQDLPPEAVSPDFLDISSICQKDSELVNLKALGIRCDPVKDLLYFVMEVPAVTRWTMRIVLKTFPRLFDPLGLLLPYTIRARCYFSSLVIQGNTWDQEITPTREWTSWLSELQDLQTVRFPRCIKAVPAESGQLHTFSDASEKAYAAATYLRTEDGQANVTVRLVRAKAHVAPLKKPQSMPRLELLAAELSAQLRVQITKSIKIKITQHFHWVDSTTVLYWVNDDKKRFQTFVFNKIQNIRRLTHEEEWRYVPTKLNPADLPSRGTRVSELAEPLWQNGPDFLLQPQANWPPQPELIKTSEVLAELRKSEQVFVAQGHQLEPTCIDFDRSSSWHRLVRAVVWVKQRLRLRATSASSSPTSDWTNAELFLIKQAQLPLHHILQNTTKLLRSQAGFTRITPFKDADGVWRGRGRLSEAKGLPTDARTPILMPKKHRATYLLMKFYHDRQACHYGGTNYLLAKFMLRFWTPAPRSLASTVIRDCVPCRRRLARIERPPESTLPDFRLSTNDSSITPFASTGMDCAGPYRVVRARSYETHYLLLLTCCKVRAVRLEPLSSLSVDSLLMALTRAASRGVNPEEIVTDNGANFTAAHALIDKLLQNAREGDVRSRRPDIKWRLNPPYASHYGGVFERLIRATKEALYHALPAHLSLTLEQLHTSFATVEAVLNSRPLAYCSTDPSDPLPLTPNHFLYGSGDLRLQELLQDREAELPLAKRYNTIKRATEQFELRFKTEIRPYMQLTSKAALVKETRDFEVGDVVVFFMPSASKKWPLARIQEVFPGKDGRVRTVRLGLPPHNAETTTYAPQRSVLRDVGNIALLLPAERQTSL